MPRKKRSNAQLDALFATIHTEAQARRNTSEWEDKAGLLSTQLMPVQARLEQDPSRRKAVRSPRQVGKSTGVMLLVSIRCLRKSLAEWVVICLTKANARAIYWGPLKLLSQQFELGIKFNEQLLTATFPNGSTIRFIGADNVSEIEKVRGNRLDGVVVDECKSYPVILFDELVHDVIEAALMAKDGELIIIGTPGDLLKGTFYDATSDQPAVYVDPVDGTYRQSNLLYGLPVKLPYKWSFHRWTLADNITRFKRSDGTTYTMWDQAQAVMRQNGWTRDTPRAAREYFGDWVPADDKRVYRYDDRLHCYDPRKQSDSEERHLRWGVPDIKGEWKTVLGMDPGTRDGTGMTVWGWNVHVDELFELYSGRKGADTGERLPIRIIAQWYRELENEFGPFEASVQDPAGLATMVMDELADQYSIYFEPADKHEKNDAIEVFNNDLDRGKIHFIRGSDLAGEIAAGRWERKKLSQNKKVEDPNIPNDVSDSGLYAARYCFNKRPKARPGPALSPQQLLLLEEAQRLAKRKADAKRAHELHLSERAQRSVSALDEALGWQTDREWWHEPN